MKITVSLTNVPLSITIEASDDISREMIDFVGKTLLKMREVWLNAVKCQMKLKVKKDDNNPEKVASSS